MDWAGFDRHRYPINPHAVRDVLLTNARSSLSSASAYSAHGHCGFPFEVLYALAWVGLRVSLPLLGPDLVLSLCRTGIPVWMSAVLTTAGTVWYRKVRSRG